MKHSNNILLLVVSLFLLSCEKWDEKTSDNKTTVILDSDMVEAFDDGVAFMVLLGSENINSRD